MTAESEGLRTSGRRRLGDLLPGARARRRQVTAYAEEWTNANATALRAGGPLWVALGDSGTQGIGAPDRRNGYILSVLRHLQETDDPSWRVVNLARTGAVVAEVLAEQVPLLANLRPRLVTCAAGANDLLRSSQSDLEQGLRSVASALPKGALIATLPQGLRSARSQAANAVIRAAADETGLTVVDLWSHTGPPWKGKYSADFFHPNEIGYRDWTAAFLEALATRS